MLLLDDLNAEAAHIPSAQKCLVALLESGVVLGEDDLIGLVNAATRAPGDAVRRGLWRLIHHGVATVGEDGIVSLCAAMPAAVAG